MIPCSYWALTCCAALPSCKTLYVISVRQTRDLPVVSLFPHPASFRFHLTMDTLAFGYILPTTRRIRDLHPLEPCAAGRTHKKGRHISSLCRPFSFSLYPVKIPEDFPPDGPRMPRSTRSHTDRPLPGLPICLLIPSLPRKLLQRMVYTVNKIPTSWLLPEAS